MMRYDVHDLSGPLRIWYHGTTEENATSILVGGFRKGTYFAKGLDSAIAFGGPWVFSVAFPKGTTSYSGWQITIWEAMGPERIIRLKKYEEELMYHDELAGQRVFASNMEAKDLAPPTDCAECGKSMREMRWADVWHRGWSSVELCSVGCVETWEAKHEQD